MAGIAQNMYHKEHSVESLNSIECLLKVKKKTQQQRPKILQGACKDDWLISAIHTLGSTSADIIRRHHYQISFTSVTLDMTGKRKAGVYPISSQVAMHSTAEIICISVECAI